MKVSNLDSQPMESPNVLIFLKQSSVSSFFAGGLKCWLRGEKRNAPAHWSGFTLFLVRWVIWLNHCRENTIQTHWLSLMTYHTPLQSDPDSHFHMFKRWSTSPFSYYNFVQPSKSSAFIPRPRACGGFKNIQSVVLRGEKVRTGRLWSSKISSHQKGGKSQSFWGPEVEDLGAFRSPSGMTVRLVDQVSTEEGTWGKYPGS